MALLFTAMLGLIAIIFAYFVITFKNTSISYIEQTITSDIKYLTCADDHQKLSETVDDFGKNVTRIYFLSDTSGKKIGGNITALPTSAKVLREGLIAFERPQTKNIFAASIHVFPDNRTLLVGIDISDIMHKYQFLKGLALFSVFLMSIVALTSFFISSFVVSRTNRIALAAQDIMNTGDLTRRIQVDNGWDDLSHMTFVLNKFIERIQYLVQGIRHVSDNIAHDLRTPLTRMLNELEALKATDDIKNSPDAIKTCDAVITEAENLLKTFNALLRISQLETSRQRFQFKPVDLSALLTDVVEFYEPLAESKKIRMTHDLQPATCYGDRDLLFQIFTNLLDNAVKYTPSGGDIRLELAGAPETATIILTDSGSGIPEAERKKVFERFYRMEQSRISSGNGLGLSLVAIGIELHDGKIFLGDAHPGLRVMVSLPTHGPITKM